jgi:hypothetical protein
MKQTPGSARKLLARLQTPESRFMLRGLALQAARGGPPTATIEQGAIVFTYPDGTRTSGGYTLSKTDGLANTSE